MNYFGPHNSQPGGEPLFHLLVPHGSHLPMTRSCPCCGLTLSALRSGSTVGCRVCYETFHDVLTPLLQQLHGSSHHAGKVPQRTEQKLRQQLDLFKEQLKEAIQEERFEEAAVLRDRISHLRQELNDPQA